MLSGKMNRMQPHGEPTEAGHIKESRPLWLIVMLPFVSSIEEAYLGSFESGPIGT